MTTAKQAQMTNDLTRRGIVQHVRLDNGIILDQDGNRFPSRLAKLEFLKSCLADGIRSGNLQPITTENQRNDLIKRINQTARECGQAEI